MNEDLTAGIPELSPGRRRLFMLEGGAMETKCVKRRRRDPHAAKNDQQKAGDQQQQQESQQADQTSTPAATTVKRSSRFRGVSRHRWTGRYEAHLWDKGTWNPTQRKKGKQVYLGAYDDEESAARAYDLAALKYWGISTFTNFPVSEYETEIEIMKTVTKEEYLASLRRRSSGFSRGVSKYRGVAKHHHNGRWEARIGRVFGNKYLYLGTYSTQEEAAHAYDIAAIEYRGINAVTNFDLSTYIRWLRPGGTNPPALQESKSALEPLPIPNFSNYISEEETAQLSALQSTCPFVMEGLDNLKKQEFLQRKAHFSPCNTKSSSPTALSLLLKSSVFKELVEKNLNNPDEEDAKNLTQIGNDNEVGEFFYDGLGHIPYLCSSERVLPSFEHKEESLLPFYNIERGNLSGTGVGPK